VGIHVKCAYLRPAVRGEMHDMGPFLFLVQATCTALLVVWASTRGTLKPPPRHIYPYKTALWLETTRFHGSLDLGASVHVQGALDGVRESVLRGDRVFSPFPKKRIGLPIAPQLAPQVQVAVPGYVSDFNASTMTYAPFRGGRVLASRTLGDCAAQNLSTTRGIVGRGVYDFILRRCRVGTLDAYFYAPVQ